MDQKQRNKIALVLTVVLVPLLIYLVVTNVAKVRNKNLSPQEPAATAAGQTGVSPFPGAEVVPPNVKVQPPKQTAPVDQKVLAEQKRIAALLPENNPFNPSRPIIADQSPVTAAPTPPGAVPPPAAPDAGIKLTAILARGSGRMAMINGRLLGEGDHIANWTIIKVTDREVLLKDGARPMVLRLK